MSSAAAGAGTASSAAPQPSQRELIRGAAGNIEVVYEQTAAAAVGLAVICHPHPLFGGTLTNKVVHTLARTLNACGYVSVRFNFRGIDASEGMHDAGRGETLDTLSVVAWARQRWPDLPLLLAGFSFGSMVSLQAAPQAQPVRVISIAPAVTREEFGAVQRPEGPWLIVQGDADEVIDAQAVQQFAARFQPPPHLVMLAGVSHFFHGHLQALGDVVRAELGVPPLEP
ncbi:MAG: alpha/beta hydrolase [Steroidobacteraceae bacterium]